jgi:cell shape-determining protein MreC
MTDAVDIVRRLRDASKRMRDHLVAPLHDEAADEIERLRAALDQEQHAASFIAEAKAENERLRRVLDMHWGVDDEMIGRRG